MSHGDNWYVPPVPTLDKQPRQYVDSQTIYDVGDKVTWQFDSCYRCAEKLGNVWCGDSIVNMYKVPNCEILEVLWGDVQYNYHGDTRPGFHYLVRIEKWGGDIREEWVPDFRLWKLNK